MSGKAVRETLGFLAVVAGLVFVGLEIRQNNRLAQAAAYQAIGMSTADAWKEMSTDVAFNTLWLEHFQADSAWWSERDEVTVDRFVSYWIGLLRQYETIYLQVALDLLDEEAMERLGWGPVRSEPAVQYLWPRINAFVGPEFRAFLDVQ